MGADIKALKGRIRSVDSTLHLTRTMGLVASSKMRRANEAMNRSREYAAAFGDAIAQLTCTPECANSPFMAQHDGGKTKLIVIAGDRGLAGGYNANVFRLAAEYPDAQWYPIGKRACDKCGQPQNSSERFSFAEAAALAETLCREFAEGQFDRLGILYTQYRSVMSQEATVRWLLPFMPSEQPCEAGMIFEPDPLTVLNRVAQEYVAGMITVCVRESFASEVAARRMAMDSAGKNAQQMLDTLQLQYNRARQGAITQEITEIVAGSGDGI